MEGWIKLHRKIIEWEWYKTPNMRHLFEHLIIVANHQDGKWKGVDVKRGQLISGIKSLCANTGISAQSVRTCIERLKSTGEITIQSTNKYSIITVCNYEEYQLNSNDINKLNNNQVNKQLTNNQQTTNNKQEYKECKEDSSKENFIKEKIQEEESEQTEMTPEQEEFYKERDNKFIERLNQMDDEEDSSKLFKF